jgi:hypothetical protein
MPSSPSHNIPPPPKAGQREGRRDLKFAFEKLQDMSWPNGEAEKDFKCVTLTICWMARPLPIAGTCILAMAIIYATTSSTNFGSTVFPVTCVSGSSLEKTSIGESFTICDNLFPLMEKPNDGL